MAATPETKTPQSFGEAFARVSRESRRNPFKKWNLRMNKRVLIIVGSILGVIALLFAVTGAFAYQKVSVIKRQVDETKVTGKEAYDALKTQNLPLAKEKLAKLETQTRDLESSVKSFAWVQIFPVLGGYYNDSEHGFAAAYAGISAAQKAVKEVEPYADVLGLQGQGSFTGGTAEDRIAKLLETLGKVTPALDSIGADLEVINKELSQIDERKYPETFRGTTIRPRITQVKALVKEASKTLTEKRPAIEVLPQIAGSDKRRKYLVLFQNAGELRPTGGFLTAYAIINVDKGKVQPEGSGDIYELDQRFTNKPAIPPILKRFLTTESRWNLRDMNLSPDYKVSAETFNSNYQKIRGQATELDGIIVVDTHFLESLVKVLGPVEVPGYGTFSAENDKRCDCPHIIYALSEIIDRPTPYIRENRKGILGPMMQAILAKAYSAPKNLWPQLFQTGWKDIEGKHVQFFFYDEKLQAAAESINAAGRVLPTPEGSDYFMQVDTNLAGAKSNFFVQTEVAHVVEEPKNGSIKRTVTVTYKNPFRPSNCNLEAGQLCLNGTLQDWVRFYLPPGAKLVDSRGFDQGSVKESEDLGHAVIEGTFRLQPLSQAKVELTYTVPYTNTNEYTLLIQKQGGTEDIKHTFTVGDTDHEVILDKDKTVTFSF